MQPFMFRLIFVVLLILLTTTPCCVRGQQQQEQEQLNATALTVVTASATPLNELSLGPGWTVCDDGISICPEYSTCCPIPGAKNNRSACMSSRHGKDPDASGQCCTDGNVDTGFSDNSEELPIIITGCPYGFTCAVRGDDESSPKEEEQAKYCQIDELNPPKELNFSQPRYELCTIDDQEWTIMHGFPVSVTEDDDEDDKSASTKQLAYYSNMGSIITTASTQYHQQQSIVEHIFIFIHGSGRNAEDYFCAATSVVPSHIRSKVLVIAPKFLSPEDISLLSDDDNDLERTQYLYWQDHHVADKYPVPHVWRYGADALNAPNISSYTTIDKMVEYLVENAPTQFPNLKRISVAGHSAGGQFVHRWALLSNSPLWDKATQNNIEIRAVPGNPRSYCYLDHRRMIRSDDDNNNNSTSNSSKNLDYKIPSQLEFAKCPTYNDWNWGLSYDGNLETPYKDHALTKIPRDEMAQRYLTSRQVTYLTGENDIQEQKDHCATYEFQGKTRHERAIRYYESLSKYYLDGRRHGHHLYTVPESPHDHIIM